MSKGIFVWIIFLMVYGCVFMLHAFSEEKLDMDSTLNSHDLGVSTDAKPSGASSQISRGNGMGDGGRVIAGKVRVPTSLNIRKSAWGEIIGSFQESDTVNIIGTYDDWYQIEYDGGVALIHQNYVETPDKPAGRVPVRRKNSSGGYDTVSEETPASPAGNSSGRFGAPPCTPMPSSTSSEFGPRALFGHSFHNGIDLPVPNGTRLNALGDGTVIDSGFESGGGNFVRIRYDNGYEQFCCHLQRSLVSPPRRVSMGEQIAASDNTGEWTTGAHLHMGMKKNGANVDPRSVSGLPLPGK
ncbi:MAG: peptidoglycan DD-metalloendopeptidase family protein [Candidatus Riflebacteria bacterium]|nr:peptidoglycan DD-metalloendopeptidase family protein [Candidatus Riflebacteria bacterium]